MSPCWAPAIPCRASTASGPQSWWKPGEYQLLFDAGRGVTQRLVQSGHSLSDHRCRLHHPLSFRPPVGTTRFVAEWLASATVGPAGRAHARGRARRPVEHSRWFQAGLRSRHPDSPRGRTVASPGDRIRSPGILGRWRRVRRGGRDGHGVRGRSRSVHQAFLWLSGGLRGALRGPVGAIPGSTRILSKRPRGRMSSFTKWLRRGKKCWHSTSAFSLFWTTTRLLRKPASYSNA